MTEPRWLSSTVVLAIHRDQIEAHGGALGMRDRGLLASALERARKRFQYQPDSDLPTLAAAYGFGLAKNHPFVDGNKRIAFQAMCVFLGLNGFRIHAREEAVVTLMLAVAGGEISEPQLAVWLRENSSPR